MSKSSNKNIIRLPSPEGICCFTTFIIHDQSADRGDDILSRDIVLPKQTHSLNVAIVSDGNEILEDTDAIITGTPGLPIGVRTADCVPVILYAEDIKAVAAVHAGWKGTLGGIVDVVVDRLADMGSDPRNIHATFGISICGNCYEVDNDLGERFIENGFSKCMSYPCGEAGKPCVDLQGANTLRLIRKGVDPDYIYNNTLCTRSTKDAYGNPLFYSWRRTPGISERNITFAYLRF